MNSSNPLEQIVALEKRGRSIREIGLISSVTAVSNIYLASEIEYIPINFGENLFGVVSAFVSLFCLFGIINNGAERKNIRDRLLKEIMGFPEIDSTDKM